MNRIITYFLALSCIIASHSSTAAERNQFTGTVRDAATGKPLQGASVYIADVKTGATTKADGSFIIRNIPAGKHLVEISYVGYASISEFVEIAENLQKDFVLSASIIESNEVIVTGVSKATEIKRTPTPVVVIKKQELLQSVSTNLIDALSKQPGISQLSTGPGISKPIIRGLGYNRVVVVNDGVRQEGQQWGDEHGIEIDEYSVSKVEILKGPASLMYGSDAMAGVINIITNMPAPENTIKANIISNYQTNNRLRGVGGNVSGNHNGFNWNLYGSYKAAADYENKYDGRVFNSKYNEKNFGGYVGYNGKWGYSHLIISHFDQKPGIIEGDRHADGSFVKLLPGGAEGSPDKKDFNSTNPFVPFQHIQHFKITSDNSFNIGKGRLALNLGYQRNQRMELGNPDDPSEKELYFDLNTGTYQASYHFAERNRWNTSVGVNGMAQSNKNKGEETLIPEYNLVDAGVFVYTQKSFDKLTISGGLRFDNRAINSKLLEEGGDVKFEAFKKDFSNVSGSAGISYLASKLVTLKFNIARGFRAPTLAELASNGTHEGTNRYEYGDRNLSSETSLQLDAGIELNTEHVSFTANLFNNSIDNFIFYRKLSSVNGGDSLVNVDGEDITAFTFDQHKANLAGLEVVLDIHPHPLDWLHIENTFSLVNGRFKEAIEGSKNIPFIPAARLLSELKGEFYKNGKYLRNLALHFSVNNVFKQSNAFTAYDTETPTSGYTLLNAGISSDFVHKGKTLFSLYLYGMNLGDVAYQDHLSRLKYAAENLATGRNGVFSMGRNFSIKLNIPLSFSVK